MNQIKAISKYVLAIFMIVAGTMHFVCSDPDFIEISHHDEILADVSAFQSPCEVVRHEPADDITTGRDDFADSVIFDFVIP